MLLSATLRDRARKGTMATAISKQLPCEGRMKRLGLFNVEKKSMRGHMAEVYKIVKAVGKTRSG